MAKTRFDSFVVLAGMRTGSNYLEANLNALAGVVCWGEVFNPSFIGKKNQLELFGITIAAREADPLAMLRRLKDMTSGLSGFRMFHDHDPRALDVVLADVRCAKIILTRNPLESYVSLQIVRETGQWKLGDGKALKTAKVRFDPRGFRGHLEQVQGYLATIRGVLQQTGQAAFQLDYDDLQDIGVLNGLARFLGVDAQLTSPDTALKKQNPAGLADKVTNLAEMEMTLAQLDLFGLGHVPAFEPRRSAGIPGFVASDDAGLLYMPMRGGTDAAVADWLGSHGKVTGEFNQKTLRQWKKGRPGHRSFTVLRHPVLRAYAAFNDRVLSAELPELSGALARNYKIDLPSAGSDFADIAAHRAAFLGFLRFVKQNLAGQTGFRVDVRWASQTAVLKGLAQFQGPDHVLREDRLAQGLMSLAAEVGVACPPIEAATLPALEAIYDGHVEAATRDAYARDYVGFGFTDWRAYAA